MKFNLLKFLKESLTGHREPTFREKIATLVQESYPILMLICGSLVSAMAFFFYYNNQKRQQQQKQQKSETSVNTVDNTIAVPYKEAARSAASSKKLSFRISDGTISSRPDSPAALSPVTSNEPLPLKSKLRNGSDYSSGDNMSKVFSSNELLEYNGESRSSKKKRG